ncbi:MAG: cytochrome c [Pyrinomonadaceae bacterium]
MLRAKLTIIFSVAVIAIAACGSSEPARFSIAANSGYESSLFRQNCAICHGPEGDGKTLDDGTVVPSLRMGEFKKNGETDIYNQISEGANGMTPFRTQLTEREMRLLTDLVHNKLRQ